MNKFINNKGFVLVETLVVTVFVVTVFTFLYINVLPLIGNYEQEQSYNSIDLKYIGNLVKVDLKNDLNNDYYPEIVQAIEKKIEEPGYFQINSCSDTIDGIKIFGDEHTSTFLKCKELFMVSNIEELYITPLNLTNFKEKVETGTFSSQLKEYVKKLPSYENIENSNSRYRLILSINDIFNNEQLYYGTIEFDFRS